MSVGRTDAIFGNVARRNADLSWASPPLCAAVNRRHACAMNMHPWNRFAGFSALAGAEDLVCLSRIRWRWIDPRLRALLHVAAQQWRVFFVEATPPAWLLPFKIQDTEKHIVRVASTPRGIWTVRPELALSARGRVPGDVLTAVPRNFLVEAGVHEPVVWHLDAMLPDALDRRSAWVTLYLKPEPREAAVFEAPERIDDAALREKSDALIDHCVLSEPPALAWQSVREDIFRAACRRNMTADISLAA